MVAIPCSPERPVPARRFAPFIRSWFLVGLLVVGPPFLGVIEPASGQTPRRLWNSELVEAKTAGGSGETGKQTATPAAPKTAKSTSASSKKEPSPSPLEPANPAPASQYISAAPAPKPLAENDAILGITVWRMRPASEEDPATLTAGRAGGSLKVTPERVETDTLLREGDRVRLTIEAPRQGYLYVIDREQYADGTSSAPFLISPALRIAGGENRVAAGNLVEIPNQSDRPPYFTLRRSKPNQTAELISVIVSREPLEGVPIGPEASRNARKLSEEQVRRWESEYAQEPEIFELAGGAGRAWTRAEQQAGTGTRLLVQEDAMPQTLYRVPGRPGQPIMIQVPLLIVE